MSAFLLRVFVFLTIFHSGNLFATYEIDENDLNLSKKNFLISGAPYGELQQNKKGTITLCFKQQEGEYDHTSLVFEMFLPTTSDEISLKMIHYGREDDCCGFGGKEKIIIDGHTDTLKKSYKAVKVSNISGNKEDMPASHKKYASWIVSNDNLLKGLIKAEEDQDKNYSPGNCVKYVKRIMETVGLRDIDFGWWITKPDNLKLLVDSYIKPKYNYKY